MGKYIDRLKAINTVLDSNNPSFTPFLEESNNNTFSSKSENSSTLLHSCVPDGIEVSKPVFDTSTFKIIESPSEIHKNRDREASKNFSTLPDTSGAPTLLPDLPTTGSRALDRKAPLNRVLIHIGTHPTPPSKRLEPTRAQAVERLLDTFTTDGRTVPFTSERRERLRDRYATRLLVNDRPTATATPYELVWEILTITGWAHDRAQNGVRNAGSGAWADDGGAVLKASYAAQRGRVSLRRAA